MKHIDIKKPDGTTVPYPDFVFALVKRFVTQGMSVAEQKLAVKLEYAHSAIGIATEGSEVADVIKAHAIYGKPLDKKALVKELGDVLFWVQDIQNKFNITDEEIIQGNGDKLLERYVQMSFSDVEAVARADKKWVLCASFAHALDGTYVAGPYEHAYEVEAARDEHKRRFHIDLAIYNLDDLAVEIERLEEQAKT